MPRLEKVVPYSGEAGDAAAAIANPLELVSRPLYLDGDGNPDPGLERWEMPESDRDGASATQFSRHWKKDPIVVIGGFQFLVTLGVIPTWLKDEATRTEAIALMRERQLEPLLRRLSAPGKEHDLFDVFGKGNVDKWFRHSPEVNRESSSRPGWARRTTRDRAKYNLAVRTEHCLRLRKAVDLMILLEAALRYRFSIGESLNRASGYTGIPANEIGPEIVWDTIWFEPINYVMSVPPRPADIAAIVSNEGNAREFQRLCGAGPGALYWILNGAPGKYRTVKAACDICNAQYEGLTPSVVTTAHPGKYGKELMKIFDQKAKIDYKLNVEYAPELGPPEEPGP